LHKIKKSQFQLQTKLCNDIQFTHEKEADSYEKPPEH